MSELENRKFNAGPLYLVAAAILWSMAGVLTKFIPWSATTVACMRGLIAAMIQMLYSRTWKIKLTKPILLTAVCYLGETLLFTFANKMTSAGSAIVLQNTSPLYIMLMGLIVLKQKPSKLDCCVGVVIFSGILLSMIDTFRGGELPGSNPMLGNLLAQLVDTSSAAGRIVAGEDMIIMPAVKHDRLPPAVCLSDTDKSSWEQGAGWPPCFVLPAVSGLCWH